MNIQTQQLLSNIAALKDTLRNVCPHCGEATLYYLEGTASCHCNNPACAGYTVTQPIEVFITMTPEQLAAYKPTQTTWAEMDGEQNAFEDRIAQLLAAKAAREAARKPSEQLFG